MACAQLVSIDGITVRGKHGWKGLAERFNHVNDVNVYLGRQRELGIPIASCTVDEIISRAALEMWSLTVRNAIKFSLWEHLRL